jgi:hypothetical protein
MSDLIEAVFFDLAVFDLAGHERPADDGALGIAPVR